MRTEAGRGGRRVRRCVATARVEPPVRRAYVEAEVVRLLTSVVEEAMMEEFWRCDGGGIWPAGLERGNGRGFAAGGWEWQCDGRYTSRDRAKYILSVSVGAGRFL